MKDTLKKYMQIYTTAVNRRMIPELFDGLLPVQRRILYEAYCMGLDSGFKKSARLTGSVAGKFHPHGDCYGALVTMVNQPVSMFEKSGNFGSHTDVEAAPRYTEVKFSKLARYIFDKDYMQVIEYTRNYTDEFDEPIHLPVRIPYFLLNGTSAEVGVGISTKFLPIDVNTIIDLCIDVLKGNKFKNKRYVPNFKYNATVEDAKLEDYSVRVVPKYSKVKNEIIITGIGDRNPLNAFEKMKTICTIYDNSNEQGIDIVLSPKRGISLEVLGEAVLKHFSYSISLKKNINIKEKLYNLSIKECIVKWIDYRVALEEEVIAYRIEKANKQLVLEELLLKVLSDRTKLFKCIDSKDAENMLCKVFKLTISEAKYILDKKIKSLNKTDLYFLKDSTNNLKAEIKRLKALNVKSEIEQDLLNFKKDYLRR